MKKIKKPYLRDYKCFAIQYYENYKRKDYIKHMKKLVGKETFFGNIINKNDFVFGFALRRTEKMSGEGAILDFQQITDSEILALYEKYFVLDYIGNIPICDSKTSPFKNN